MRALQIKPKSLFKILAGTERSQLAEMVIAPGKSEGGPHNRHPRSDQWLYVVKGKGIAFGTTQKIHLKEGTLLLIEKGDPHQIQNIGRTPLRTFNIYTPPTY